MLQEQIRNFREITTLADGTRVLFRPMNKEDHDQLVYLFSSINENDLKYFRHNVKNPDILHAWVESLDYGNSIPLLALVNEQTVGNATLHLGEGPRRHIGEIRIFLSRDYRKRGLGIKLLRSLIEIGRKQGLHMLNAEVIAENLKLIKAFESLGFKQQCTLQDYFMFPDGECIDVKMMLLTLKVKVDEY